MKLLNNIMRVLVMVTWSAMPVYIVGIQERILDELRAVRAYVRDPGGVYLDPDKPGPVIVPDGSDLIIAPFGVGVSREEQAPEIDGTMTLDGPLEGLEEEPRYATITTGVLADIVIGADWVIYADWNWREAIIKDGSDKECLFVYARYTPETLKHEDGGYFTWEEGSNATIRVDRKEVDKHDEWQLNCPACNDGLPSLEFLAARVKAATLTNGVLTIEVERWSDEIRGEKTEAAGGNTSETD